MGHDASLALKNMGKIIENPQLVEKIFNSKDFAKKYENLVKKTTSHVSQGDYCSPTKKRSFLG